MQRIQFIGQAGERSPTQLSSMHSNGMLLCIHCQTSSDEVRMREMFHVKHGVDVPPTRSKLTWHMAHGTPAVMC